MTRIRKRPLFQSAHIPLLCASITWLMTSTILLLLLQGFPHEVLYKVILSVGGIFFLFTIGLVSFTQRGSDKVVDVLRAEHVDVDVLVDGNTLTCNADTLTMRTVFEDGGFTWENGVRMTPEQLVRLVEALSGFDNVNVSLDGIAHGTVKYWLSIGDEVFSLKLNAGNDITVVGKYEQITRFIYEHPGTQRAHV